MKKIIIQNSIFLILILAFFLRFYRLGDYPALNADEAAIGYNAYSLLETGKDEHGNRWPIHFQSFNDFKPGLYFYIVLPFVKVLGLSEWSVRIPNALLGVYTVYLVYVLVNRLFSNLKNSHSKTHNSQLGLIAAFFLSINPWHIHFSRGGWEVNTATFLITLGVYLFLKSIQNLLHPERTARNDKSSKSEIFQHAQNNKFRIVPLFLSAFVFSLSLYAYHAARIISPLLVLGLVGIYWNELKYNIKILITTALFGLIIMLPLINDLVKSDVLSRAAGVGLFADTGPLNRINEQRGEHGNFRDLTTKILHNKPVNYALAFADNWFAHYHGLFLFLSGDDIERDKVPETGQMYLFDVFWIVVGLWWLLKNISSRSIENKILNNIQFKNKSGRLIIYWLLVAPIAAALTFQSPHALRAQNMVIPLIIIASFGFVNFIEWLSGSVKNKPLLTTCYLLLTTLILWQFARYQHLYWTHMSKEYPYSSQYGVKELVEYVSDKEEKYSNIIITTKYDQPYILFLFYNTMLNPQKYTPSQFQGDHILSDKDQFGFSTVPAYYKYVFKSVDWDNDKVRYNNSLIVGSPDEIPREANIVEKISGSNGYEYFVVVAN